MFSPSFGRLNVFPIIFWLVLFLGQKEKEIDHDCYLCSSVSDVSFSFWLLL